MEWIKALQGQLIALDTAPLIYFIEEHPTYLPILDPFFENFDKGSIRVVTSVITLKEWLILGFEVLTVNRASVDL
ncbi:MAG: hypothetical protein VSS75_034120 [Candidatus Parabeggiatoa sp.]|nr:hypothetical protein [Candidatus Parabeggiatoa sp.]